MDELRETNVDAYRWLAEKDPKHWSKTFLSGYLVCDILLSNVCEAFNSTLFEAQDKLIITLCETIRRYLARRVEAKRVEGSKWKYGVGPRIWKLLHTQKNLKKSDSPYY